MKNIFPLETRRQKEEKKKTIKNNNLKRGNTFCLAESPSFLTLRVGSSRFSTFQTQRSSFGPLKSNRVTRLVVVSLPPPLKVRVIEREREKIQKGKPNNNNNNNNNKKSSKQPDPNGDDLGTLEDISPQIETLQKWSSDVVNRLGVSRDLAISPGRERRF